MAGYRMVKSVHRKPKATTKPLKILMVVLTVLFVLLAIVFTTGYMLFAFIFAVLYLYFDANAGVDYEYTLLEDRFTIEVIRAKRKRTVVQELDLGRLIVVAPHDHEMVKMYKKGHEEGNLRKFDYTSYEEDVPYYTMIVSQGPQKVKILLDLEQDMLMDMKRRYPNKVFFD